MEYICTLDDFKFYRKHIFGSVAMTHGNPLACLFVGLLPSNIIGHIRRVTVYTHGNFVVLPHWETMPAP